MPKGNVSDWAEPKFGRNVTYKFDAENKVMLIKVDMNGEYNRSGGGEGKSDVGATCNVEVSMEGKKHWFKGNLLRALDDKEYKLVKLAADEKRLAARRAELGLPPA
jgi:hypothetical protein